MTILKLIKNNFTAMRKISREDYRTLELKLHSEIQTIFSEFMEDQKNMTVLPDATVTAQDQRKPGYPRKSEPEKTTPDPAGPRKPRKSRRSLDVNKILHNTPGAGTANPKIILESDMDKIFRKKHRRGSQ